MFPSLTRGAFLRVALASLLFGCGGGDDSKDASTTCAQIDESQAKANVLAKLKQKHPDYSFSIALTAFDPKAKFPFWLVQAVTTSDAVKQMIFAMHYCDNSIELTALVPYEEQPKAAALGASNAKQLK